MSLPAQAPPAPPPPLILRLEDEVPVLEIPQELPYEELREWLAEVLPPHLDQIDGRVSRLDLAERELKLFDLRRLVHFLREEHAVEVSGLYVRPESVHRFAERELKLKLFPHLELEETEEEPGEDLLGEQLELDLDEEPAPEVLEPLAAEETGEDLLREPESDEDLEEIEPSEELPRITPVHRPDPGRRTLSLHRTLRSGASVRFDGDVFVFGDVNPGAQIIASGNVVVLGTLKGLAHAGATGDEESFVFAFDLRPTQIRIGRKIAIPPEEDSRPDEPELARLVDEQIVIDPYRVRSPR